MRDDGGHHHKLLPRLHASRGDADELVALALAEYRQGIEREQQHAPLVGDGHAEIRVRRPYPLGRHDDTPFRHGEQRLAVLVLTDQVVVLADEAVTGVRTDEVRLALVTHHQMAHLFTGPQREATGERLALTAGRGQSMGLQRVGTSQGREEHRLLVAAAMGVGQITVPRLVGEALHVHVVTLGGAHPALVGEDHGHRLARGELLLGQGHGGGALHQRGAAIVAVLLGVRQDLFLQQGAETALGTQDQFQLVALFGQFILLGAQLELFELGQVAQFELEDRLRLGLADVETLHHHPTRLFLGADDLDHLVDVEIGDQQAFEDVQAGQHLVEAILQAAAHRLATKAQPLGEDGLEVFDLGTVVQTQDVEVDPVVLLQVRGSEQVGHQPLHVHPVGARHDHQTGRVLMVRFIPQVGDHGQLLGHHLGGNLLHDLGA